MKNTPARRQRSQAARASRLSASPSAISAPSAGAPSLGCLRSGCAPDTDQQRPRSFVSARNRGDGPAVHPYRRLPSRFLPLLLRCSCLPAFQIQIPSRPLWLRQMIAELLKCILDRTHGQAGLGELQLD